MSTQDRRDNIDPAEPNYEYAIASSRGNLESNNDNTKYYPEISSSVIRLPKAAVDSLGRSDLYLKNRIGGK